MRARASHSGQASFVALLMAFVGFSCSACGSAESGGPVDPPSTGPAPAEPAAPSAPSETAKPAPGAAPSPTPIPAPVTAPAALACLAQLYVGTPVADAASPPGWTLRFPDATEVPWNDGNAKTYDQKLATPDLEDTLSMPYVLGGITPKTTLNDDPGRIRSDALFKATYGATSAAVQQHLVTVDFVGQQVKFHARAAAALGKVSVRLEALIATTPSLAAYVTGELGGTFEWRPIANTNRLSAHSYGIAIDIVVAKSNYWEWEKPWAWKNQIPQAIVDAFEAEGFAWGGRWYHYDTMHFEYRPELFAAACKP
jgi:hypothetical protein